MSNIVSLQLLNGCGFCFYRLAEGVDHYLDLLATLQSEDQQPVRDRAKSEQVFALFGIAVTFVFSYFNKILDIFSVLPNRYTNLPLTFCKLFVPVNFTFGCFFILTFTIKLICITSNKQI